MPTMQDILDASTKPFLCPVEDEAFATAYDAVDASLRARLKTNIALHHSIFGTAPSLQIRHTERANAGFVMSERRRSVSWAILVLTEHFASGPRLIAALMPALLAGVSDVQVIRLVSKESEESGQQSPWPHELLAALELAGQEQVVSAELADVVNYVKSQSSCGRVVLLGEDVQAQAQLAHAMAHMGHVNFWAEGHAPRMYVESGQDFDTDLIRWAHPDCILYAEPIEQADAIFSEDMSVSPCAHAPLVLQKGCEALWMYTALRPEFFIQDTVTIALANGDADNDNE